MSKKISKPLTIALSAALVGSFAATSANAATDAENPFVMDELNSGYQLAGGHEKEGSCGEGKCGDDKKDGEGSCGEDKDDGEGSCGEGKCGGGIA